MIDDEGQGVGTITSDEVAVLAAAVRPDGPGRRGPGGCVCTGSPRRCGPRTTH